MTRVSLETDIRPLVRIIDDINSGSLALADFQRDFDWSERDARSLLATMLMGWPAGSVLFLRGETTRVGSRGFVDGPITVSNPPQVVLDGQQRLTTAYHALTDRGRVVHAIRLSALVGSAVEELEDGMRSFSRARWDSRLRFLPWLGSELLVPMYALRDPDSFFEFRDLAVSTQPPSAGDSPDRALQRAWRDRLGQLSAYQFPVVMIQPAPKAEIDDAAVARIFERINRTGQRLGAFDLVVARASPDTNLRELWEEARLSDEVLDRWLGDRGLSEDGMPLLQAISLRRPPHDVRQTAVLDLPADLVTSEWPRAVHAASRALRFLSSECGVLRSDWLPYRAMLVALIGFAMEHDPFNHGELLSHWFWSRAFGLRFDAAANTRTGEDFVLLKAAANDGDLLSSEPVRHGVLLRATRRRYPAVFRALLCLLVLRDAADLHGKSLGLRDAAVRAAEPEDDVVVTSVLPREPESELHLRAMSMVLAFRATAQDLRARGLTSLDHVVPQARETQMLPPTSVGGDELLMSRTERLGRVLVGDLNLRVVRESESEL